MSTNINFMWNVENKGALYEIICCYSPLSSANQWPEKQIFQYSLPTHLSNILLLNKFQLRSSKYEI